MLVNILYNLTDTFFIGKLNDPYQVAAVSIALPLFTFQMDDRLGDRHRFQDVELFFLHGCDFFPWGTQKIQGAFWSS